MSTAMETLDLGRTRDRAQATLSAEWAGARLGDLQRLPSGVSSLTFMAPVEDAPHDRLIVKVAPPGLEPVRNRDVLRQGRILAALGSVEGVRVPELLGADPGNSVDEPQLIVMQFVPGISYEPLLDAPGEIPPPVEDILGCGEQAARMLAALQDVRPADIGLGNEPVSALDAEVERWRRAFATCPLEPALAMAVDTCHARLVATLPRALPPVVVHGDWRLGNMQCQGADVMAVIDWEICSIGDPRLDLAWLMLMAEPGHPSAEYPQAPMMSPLRFRQIYEDAAGATVPDLMWFAALVRYKQAAATALLVKHAAKRDDPDPRYHSMRSAISALTYWCLGLLHE
jgi:aminoglycoside phosphotransferase (APT) family kinase protein